VYLRGYPGLRNDGGRWGTWSPPVSPSGGLRPSAALAHLGGPPDFQAAGIRIGELRFDVTGQNGQVSE
jgi:hypothetical protein